MLVVPRARFRASSCASFFTSRALVACSYDFGGGAADGGAGGSTASQVYVAASQSGAGGPSGSSGAGPGASGAVTAADASATVGAQSTATTGGQAVCGNGIVEPGESCEGSGPAPGTCTNCVLCGGGVWDATLGRCYLYQLTNDGQDECAAACAQWMSGGHLADPRDADQTAVLAALVPGTDTAYIGVREGDNGHVYSDGSPLDWNPPWGPPSPVDLLPCVGIVEAVGFDVWVSVPCDNLTDIVSGYLCEWRAPG